jgi:tRNA-dihydrouridine synthase A
MLLNADAELFGAPARDLSPAEIVDGMASYIGRELASGTRLHGITRHMVGLFQGQPGARGWRRTLSEAGAQRDPGIELLHRAIECLTPQQLVAAL